VAEVAKLLRDESGLKGKLRWRLNRWLLRRLGLLRRGTWVTVYDAFGAPGDTLLTAIVCRNIAERFPGVRINCITPNPELLVADPHIARLNGPESYICLRHWYLELIENKLPGMNVLEESFRTLGMAKHEYRAAVYLTEKERREGAERLAGLRKPIVSLNARSKEPVKTWPVENWRRLVELLRTDFDLVQLGDGTEPALDGVRSFAGKLTLRESMGVLAHAKTHVGPDSFLMHAANGLGVRSVILLGGSRTVANTCYEGNINMDIQMPCGPCYIHESRGEKCLHGIECMAQITVERVHAAVLELMNGGKPCK
jgi:ADP-heptose:LPS heptosyltransferase